MVKRRKHYTPEEKVCILRRHLVEKVPVSDLCQELEANSARILCRSPSRCQGIATSPAPKPKLPDRLRQPHQAEGWDRIQMPHALDRRSPNAGADWRCQWVLLESLRGMITP
jgi:hypothetical protein